MDVKGEVKLLRKFKKKKNWGGGEGWVGGEGLVRGGCEQRSEAFVKIPKKKMFFLGGRGGGGSGWM